MWKPEFSMDIICFINIMLDCVLAIAATTAVALFIRNHRGHHKA